MPGMKKTERGDIGQVFERLTKEIGEPVEFELPDWLNKWRPDYKYIKRNIYLTKKVKRRVRVEDDGIFCSCSSTPGSSGVCGRDCHCGNACQVSGSSNCKCDSSCLNKPFHQRPVKKMNVVQYLLVYDRCIIHSLFPYLRCGASWSWSYSISELDVVFAEYKEEASGRMDALEKKFDEGRAPTQTETSKPPIKMNVYVPPPRLNETARRTYDDLGFPLPKFHAEPSTAIGKNQRSDFIEMLQSSCSSNCKCDSSCLNKPFHQRPVKKMNVVQTEKCGSGVVAEEDIMRGEFVIEYVGEVIDDKTCEERLWRMKRQGETNFYLCEINRDMVIDATYKGNKSRYINHSCSPNTEMQKWRIDGETRIGIFATRNIKMGEHLTYDYQFVQFGADQDCHCGAVGCRRKLGVKPNKSKLSSSDAALKLVACQVAINSPKVKAVLSGKDLVVACFVINKANSVFTQIMFEDGVTELLDLTQVQWELACFQVDGNNMVARVVPVVIVIPGLTSDYDSPGTVLIACYPVTTDPRKVRMLEREVAENERPIVTVAKHRTVTLLPTFVGFDSVAGQDNVEPTVPVTEPVEAEIPRPKRSKKKRVTYDSEGLPVASHPPKRLRADYGTTGGSATGGKSPSVLNRLLQDSRLTVEQGVPALPTLPFITSSVTASPLEEGGDRTDSVTGPSLRTIGPSARFVVLSDSSHHSGAKSADPEVDSLVSKDKSAPHPSIFGSLSSSKKTDRTLSLFIRRSGSGFDAGSIRAEETVRRMEHEQLFTEFNVSAARNLSLSSEVRMRAEYNILEKRKWRSLAEEKNILLEANRTKDIEELIVSIAKCKRRSPRKRCLLLSLKYQKQKLVNQVHELEISSADLREKLKMYEGSLKQLEEFKDNLMGPLRTRDDFNVLSVISVTLKISCFFNVLSIKIVEKMERNLIERLPFLKDVFMSIDDPLSAEALIEPPAEQDYDNPDSADVVPENATLGSESEGKIDASARGGLTFS
ncbi:histone-lysine N-methyltransferase ASHH3 [Tanacetum coccineum]